MEDTAYKAIAIVGTGAVLPDAPNVPAFWENIKQGRYSITEVSPERWDPAFYYDPDPRAPDKCYSKIGGWVREFEWDPFKWRMPLPPRVYNAMDEAQRWAISCTRQALEDYGYPKRPLDLDRTAVILGNAMAGEKHYLTALRAYFPEYAAELEASSAFAALPEPVRRDITAELHKRIGKRLPEITEDSMPGELANCIAGRIANLYNFHGPNYVCDAACASAMAAITSAAEGLIQNDFDVVITGGIDRNMGASTFIKFCKIGALSGTGSRPYAEGADGFVMGEGAAVFVMKRLADAERDGDNIYAVLRGIAGSSDGRGKGITAPNPLGQRLCVERAWKNSGLSPATVTYVEGHGTSTKVGDVVEVQGLVDVLKEANLPPGSVGLGSVKSNIGHLKGAASAAAFLKAALALRDKVLPPSVNFKRPNPEIDFAHSPLYVNTELKPWTLPGNLDTRRAGLSAFGFGGTNFHAILEEYIPHKLTGNGNGKRSIAVPAGPAASGGAGASPDVPATAQAQASAKPPLRGVMVIGAASEQGLSERLRTVMQAAEAGRAPVPALPAEAELRAPERLAIDYADAAELADKSAKALKALAANQAPIWKALRAMGIFRGHGPAPKVAFLYTGQGSQYVNMMKSLRAIEPIVAETFAEADRIMTPLLGKPLSEFIFVDKDDASAIAQAEADLMQTAITQPAVLATDLAMTRLLAAYGIRPDMTMGHSLGEYGALVAAGGLPFADALEAVSARGREMTRVSMADNGHMAAVFAPLLEIERILKSVNGYVVIANINSNTQSVIGGASNAVDQAVDLFLKAGYNAVPLPVSHAFHTSIVAPASAPLRQTLERLHLQSPELPIVANVNGEFYPKGSNVVPQMLDILARQVASPVQFIKGLQTLYAAGARVFVEVGPKKALQGFVDDVLGERGDVSSLFTNHPKIGDVTAFNQALCGLYAAGLGHAHDATPEAAADTPQTTAAPVPQPGHEVTPSSEPVVITGAAVGLPGTDHIFDDANVARILRGDQFIEAVPMRFREAMCDKHITRLVKSENGGPVFETIKDVGEVIKLAARGRAFDLEAEYGLSSDRVAALDRVTRLAIAAGIDALRDAGIPLLMRYKTTTKGTQLPDRWALPDEMRDSTGVIFASAFPGYDSFSEILTGYHEDRARREQLAMLERVRASVAQSNDNASVVQELDQRIRELRAQIEEHPYVFDRRFLFRTLSMGHSQFAEYIGARGPNTQINAACASTAQAISLAEDWIRVGRCRRVIVISADDVTSDNLLDWMGAGFLASGAAATDEVLEDAAIPFDRRRHGMLIGMGAAALVVESADAARERGLQPICEVLSSVTANSAFHGSRLDVQHIGQVMEDLIATAEKNSGISRHEIAPQTVFVSHETYTPARGGSASAEIYALRHVFGEDADRIVIANTKGMTGHAMGTGVEDVVAVKALETGCIPPVANFKEVDPELGLLNLSKGGSYPVEYAIHLGAGFGSQISMALLRWVKTKDGVRRAPDALGYAYRIADPAAWTAWLERMTGQPAAELELVNRTLRVRDKIAAARVADLAQNAPAPQPKPTVVELKPKPEPAVVAAEPVKLQAMAAAAAVSAPVAVPSTPVSPPPLAAAPLQPAAAKVLAPTHATDPASVKAHILSIVADKTGYPPDMLDVDLDLEADLGVDTVKQAEVFAAVREAYGIARDDSIRLRDFPTLAHVIRFVHERTGKVQAEPPVTSAQAPQEVATRVEPEVELPKPAATAIAPVAGDTSVKDRILALVVEKTGYPQDMLDLDLDLEADLGVDTVKQAEMFAAIREVYSIPRDENLKLRDFPTLAHVIQFVFDRRPDLAGNTPAARVNEPAAATTVAAPPTPPATEPPVAVTQSPAQPITIDAVKEKLLEIVAEKTGYPKDMLDLDLDLEADLGVDTVKQAEMFAAVRGAYNIPRNENLKLRDFPTLAHVIRFVLDNRPDLLGATLTPAAPQPPSPEPALAEPSPAPVGAVAAPEAPAETAESVKEKLLEIVAEKTGYPKDMLDLDLDLEADLGVDTVKQAEMFAAVRGAYNIPRDENLKLRDFPTLAHVIRFVFDKRPDLAGTAPSVAAEVKAPEQAAELTPAPAPVATPNTTVSDEEIKDKVLEIVAEKTGYPKDMLDLDLDLEADLGVDTVKQAEMFAAVRAAYNIPRDENLKLRDFPTLAHVIKFAHDRLAVAPAAAPATPPTPDKPEPAQALTAPPAAPQSVPRQRPEAASFDAANSIPRRVPVPNLRPPLAVCKPTGVKLAPGSRVIVMPDESGTAHPLTEQLQALGVQVLQIDSSASLDTLEACLKNWLAAGPVQGIYWLPALTHEGDLAAMDLATWHDALRLRLKSLYVTMRILYEQIAAPGNFLVSAVRLGGQHGYDPAGAIAPLGGAVVGFTKTYKRERPDCLVKAVDFEAERQPAEIAALLIQETLRDPGAVEIGYRGALRWTVGLQEQPAADGQPGLALDENTVFLITGAAGSIVSAITADLATASGGAFYLLDLVPEPDPNNPDLKRFVTDKDGLKRDLFARIQARGERATPALVEKELAALERAQAAQSAIDAVRNAGGTPHYFSVNLTDADAVARVIRQVRERSGRIDVLLHAAGMERSHFLPAKDPREFDLVFDVKSDGWFNLLHAIGDMPLGATVAFSSIAGRFGNAGQTDYSSANDLLCKITSGFRSSRPATRGIVIDWTAWGGIGMATRGSIPKMMEVAGIDMLPPEAGVPLIRRELTVGGTRGEVVIGRALGVLLNEPDPTGGLDPEAAGNQRSFGPMIGKIESAGLHSGLVIETVIDPAAQAFLHDHQIDGTPVLPGVMGIEAFAEAASCLLPGWQIEAVEDVNFLAPFKFYRGEPRTLHVQATLYAQADAILANCRLIGTRTLPNLKEPQVTTHFTARVRLRDRAPEATKMIPPAAQPGTIIKAKDIYRVYFHGPAYQVIERAWSDGKRMLGEMSRSLPAHHNPAERPLLMAPRLIELCFQTAGLWEMAVHARMGLPLHVDRVSLLRAPELAKGALYAAVTPLPDQGFDAEVLDAAGNRYVQLRGYRTVALPNVVSADLLKPLQAAIARRAVA